jgi:hypothetical protein
VIANNKEKRLSTRSDYCHRASSTSVDNDVVTVVKNIFPTSFRAQLLPMLVMLLIGSAGSQVLAAVKSDQGQPNILVIWGDDIGIWNLSAYSHGGMGYRTPTLIASPVKARCSPITMPNPLALPDAQRSSLVSCLFAPD